LDKLFSKKEMVWENNPEKQISKKAQSPPNIKIKKNNQRLYKIPLSDFWEKDKPRLLWK